MSRDNRYPRLGFKRSGSDRWPGGGDQGGERRTPDAPPSSFALACADLFTEAKDKALDALREKGVPAYTCDHGEIVEADNSLRNERKA